MVRRPYWVGVGAGDGTMVTDLETKAELRELRTRVPCRRHRGRHAGPLVAAKAEIQSLKDMLVELRQSRDDWKAQAERLAGKLIP